MSPSHCGLSDLCLIRDFFDSIPLVISSITSLAFHCLYASFRMFGMYPCPCAFNIVHPWRWQHGVFLITFDDGMFTTFGGLLCAIWRLLVCLMIKCCIGVTLVVVFFSSMVRAMADCWYQSIFFCRLCTWIGWLLILDFLFLCLVFVFFSMGLFQC